MANQNVMLGFPNRIDDSSLSGGSWLAALPLANLKNRTLGKVARSVDLAAASTWFKIDLGASKKIRALDLRNHNFSLGAKVRIRATNEGAGANLIPNSGSLIGTWFTSGSGYFDEDKYPDPAGGNDASRWDLSAGGGKYIRMNGLLGVPNMVAGQLYTVSAFVRKVSGSGRIYFGLETPFVSATLDVDTMTIVGLSAGCTAKVYPCLDGWYRFAFTFTGNTSGNKTIVLYRSSGAPIVDLYGDQIEAGTLTSYAQGARALGFMDAWQPYDYDSGWIEAWPIVYPYGALEWEDDNWWSRQYADEERAGYTAGRTHVLPADDLARFVRVDISDPLNPAGFVQLGRVFIGPAWQPSNNMSRGVSLAWETGTEVQEAYSGAEFFGVKTPYRVVRFALDWLTESEGLSQAFELLRRAGVDKEVLFIFDPTDTIHALRRQFLGRLRQLSPIEFPYTTVTKNAFEIKENL